MTEKSPNSCRRKNPLDYPPGDSGSSVIKISSKILSCSVNPRRLINTPRDFFGVKPILPFPPYTYFCMNKADDRLKLNAISDNSTNNHERNFCSKHPQIYRKNEMNINQTDYDINRRDLCRSPITNNISDKEDSPSELVELLNVDKKLEQKEKIMYLDKKSSTEEAIKSSAKSSITKSYAKSKPLWKFIYKFIEDNSEELILLKKKYDTGDGFFTYLSELLIDKLSNETRFLKNLHRNTIKTLPKVIIAIYLLYYQKIESITGDILEKKSGMVGQYKKLKKIAEHLGLELPFIMGDIVERILEEKKEDILKKKIFPSPKNVCRFDNRLTPSRKMVKTISRWIQKNTNFTNLSDLKQKLFEKNPPKPKDNDPRLVLFDKDKHKNSAILRRICDSIIKENPKINSYNAISKEIDTRVTDLMRTKSRHYMKYSGFLKLQELYRKPIEYYIFIRSFRLDKWVFLWQDSKGNILSDIQAKRKAGEYLVKNILKNDINRYDLDYIINFLKRSDFISALEQRGFRYNEILEVVGLSLNLDVNKWDKFKWSSEGNPRTYEEAVKNAVKYLKKLILNENYNFKTDVASYTYLTNNHWDFLGALARNNLNYYDILIKAGFPDDKGRKKWKILDADENGFLFNQKEQYRHILRFFRDNILPIYKEKGLIEEKIGPTYNDARKALKKTDYHGFICASNARGISLGELLNSVGLSPRVTLNQKVGVAFHWIAEYHFMMHTRNDNNCISYYESKIHDDDEYRPDNTIIVNKKFRGLSKFTIEIPLKIKFIHVDYYLFHSSRRSNYKYERGYQSNDSMLLLVPLNIKKSRKTQRINIKILSIYDFCTLLGFSHERTNEFINFARLALRSTDEGNTEELEKLLEEGEKCKNKLMSNPKINFKLN